MRDVAVSSMRDQNELVAEGVNWQVAAGDYWVVAGPLTGLDLRHISWWLGILDALSRGHALLDGRPMTLVVTAADLRPWKNQARQFAVLKNKRFSVLGHWSHLESVTDEQVQELL